MNLRLRLTLAYSMLLAGALIAFGIMLHLLFARSLRQQLDARIAGQTQGMAHLIQREAAEVETGRGEWRASPRGPRASRYAATDQHLAREIAEEAVLTQDLYVQLLDPAGRPVYVSNSLGPASLGRQPAAGAPAFSTVNAGALGSLRCCTLALPVGGRDYSLATASSLAPAERAIGTLDRILLVAMPLMLAVVGLAGFIMADRALRPVARVTAAARAIRAGDISRRIALAGPADELKELADTFDEMIAALEQLMTAQRQFLADASHELRTPLTVILSALEVALRAPDAGPASERETLAAVCDAARRMKRLVDDLMLLARADLGEQTVMPEPLALRPLISEVAESARWIIEGRRLRLDLGDAPVVMADPDRLRQLLFNLLDNAAKHTPANGEIRLSLSRRNGAAVVTVADDGEGIPAEHLAHIFERFYRVDKARGRRSGGTGLGLAIGRWIAEAHGGCLDAESRVGQGTTFTLTLPLPESEAPSVGSFA